MLAAQLVTSRVIEVNEVDKPSFGMTSILIKVKFTAICGTDLNIYRNASNVDLPRTLGHEITGIVADKGENVTRVEIGDRVVVDPVYFCGQCQLCSEGKSYLCPKGGLLGRESDGGFAEYVVVNEINVFKIPEDISFAEATQIQTLSTIYHSQKRLHVEPGKSIMVVGMGVTGLLHVQLAKASGATPIVAVDVFQSKLELAKKYGADVAIKVPDSSAIDKIRNATRGKGPSAVIEAVGIPSTVSLSMESVASGGKVLLFGVGHQPFTGWDSYIIYFKELNVVGTRAASNIDWQPSIDLVENGSINLKPLVTHILPLQDVQTAFAVMDEGGEGVIRVVVEMPEKSEVSTKQV